MEKKKKQKNELQLSLMKHATKKCVKIIRKKSERTFKLVTCTSCFDIPITTGLTFPV